MNSPTTRNWPTEAQILAEIERYEQDAARLADPSDTLGRGRRAVCLCQIRYRRKLLAALRDGRPEDWAQYRAV